jgi:dephospho-CoA kinase
MYILGIVGGVASGKSFIANAIQTYTSQMQSSLALRTAALNADAVGHEVLRDAEVITAFRERWGNEILDSTGSIARAQVAAKVFGNHPEAIAERAFLEHVTHPRIRARLETLIAQERSNGTSLLVLDAALLFETNWHLLCNGVLFIDTPRDVRLSRAFARGWKATDFTAREESQWSEEEKRRRATWVLENSGPLANVQSQIAEFYAANLAPAILAQRS